MLTRERLIRRSWPTGSIDLLLRAGAAPEPQARSAWQSWLRAHDFDRLKWEEMRLIAAFSGRIVGLDPSSPLNPRIEGLAKHLWTSTQLALLQAADAFDHLLRTGIPFMIFKGSALHAEGFGPSCRRVMGDVDLLVRRESAGTAIDALTEGGWSSANGESPAYLRRLADIRISGNYRKGRHGDVDLHITPFHFSRADKGLDDALWRAARPAQLALRQVLIPDPADAIVISLAHAPHSVSGDWAVDVITRITHQEVDWNKLVRVVKERRLVLSCLSGLLYLRNELDVAVPEAAIAALTDTGVSAGDYLKYRSNVTDRRGRKLLDKALNRIADAVLKRGGYSYFLKDRAAVTVTRTVSAFERLRRKQALPVPSPEWGLVHRIEVGTTRLARRLVVELAIAEPFVSRRVFFDVTADGVAIARLRSRAGRSGTTERRLKFSLPLPAASTDMAVLIEARPVSFLGPKASVAMQEEFGPTRFRLVAAWTN